ncbi:MULTISPECIES: hypothetical protein [unclassified Streptomyces]|uniref:hypothetical protein n=1 Tax=unclassified Streptomyces TaxID=2593676 RepID=UPI002DDB1C29|nr:MULTISPECIES: hypothetical protein [unclassified Streptomyces]WSA96814.1 hypothetical protein OIE63_38625 [Streptomyces sp. NBC_01795]WSB81229.1 hypothetical protein OHB04_39745 [Streptomyces sp. NBC_01775]WSS10563.1 hypothetical protein OG533_00530 [Streptomyces sp. NBC_01186]WSS39256.1 hypothetical protein OG220_00530 [Streptomyces sp. NBC_01187]
MNVHSLSSREQPAQQCPEGEESGPEEARECPDDERPYGHPQEPRDRDDRESRGEPDASAAPPHGDVSVEFAAFCALYQSRYQQYARSRLADAETADVVVRMAFEELAQKWEQALRSPHTNAYAWRLLTRHVRTSAQAPEEAGAAGHSLAGHADDTRILHEDLGFSFTEATEMMGHAAPRHR